MKNTMNYEAPVAEMIEMQASMVLMASGTPGEPPFNGGPGDDPMGGDDD
jgi:hypothetical protein